MTAIQRVQFSGINRDIDEGISSDGQCMELINARISHGSVEPIGRPIPIAVLGIEGVKGMYWHAMAGRYIVTTDKSVYSVEIDEANHATTATNITGVEGVTDVQFVGYVACFISDKIQYAIYDGKSTSGYKVLGAAPTLPRLSFTVENEVKGDAASGTQTDNICIASDRADRNNYYNGRSSSEIDIENTVDYAASGSFKKIQSTLNKQGIFAGVTFVLVRYALRLSTGDYAFHSPIILIDGNKLTYAEGYTIFNGNTSSTGNYYMRTGRFHCYMGNASALSGGELVKINCGTAGFRLAIEGASDLSEWNGLVTGLDVFVAPISNYKEIPYSDAYDKYASAYPVLRIKSTAELVKEIGETATFYKYASFDINGNKIWQVDDVSTDNLTVQDKLPDDGYSHNGISGTSHVYNSRLHIGNLTEKFFEGYDNDYNVEGTNISTAGDSQTTYTYINTQQGMLVVKNESTAPTEGINPYLCYPDSRAVKMVIVKGGKTYQKDLTTHGSLNLAYSLEAPAIGTETSDKVLVGNMVYNDTISKDQYYYSKSALQTSITLDEPTVNDTIQRHNVLKVSALNNPLYFPADQTYQPCNGTIMGMCSNTAALSQGQFGQYPLYVFCDDGVYALSVGTSGIAYASQSPVTRDVCTNSKSIAGTDSQVVFASQKGLMAIQGVQVQLLSEDLDGYLPSCIDSSPIIGKVIDVAKMSDAISTVEFRTYIEGASVAYNYEGGFIYVSNPDYGYIYCYDLKSQSWCKMSPNMSLWVNRYPQCYAVSADGWLYDMQNSHRCIAQMLLLSKPIKFGSTSYKRILQTALRGIVKRSKSDLYLRGEEVKFRDESLILFDDIGMYVLGSNDAEHFTLINGKEKIVDMRDLVTRMNRAKAWKYFMVCLAGGVRTDVSINTVEFTIDETYNNRLR